MVDGAIPVIKEFPTKPGTYCMTVRDFYQAFQAGKFVPYENNRGIGAEATGNDDEFSGEFDPRISNLFHFGLYKFCMTLGDGHRRTFAVVEAIDAKTFDPKLMDEIIRIQIHDCKTDLEFVELYHNLNKQKAHVIRTEILSKDLKYGRVFKNVFEPELVRLGYLSSEISKIFKSKFVTHFGYVLYALDQKLPQASWSYVGVYKIRSGARKDFLVPAERKPLDISLESSKKLSFALCYYLDYVKALKIVAESKSQYMAILSNASWFCFIITELMADKCKLPSNPARLACITVNEVVKLSSLVTDLSSKNLDMIERVVERTWKCLDKNSRKGNWYKHYKPLGQGVPKIPRFKEDGEEAEEEDEELCESQG